MVKITTENEQCHNCLYFQVHYSLAKCMLMFLCNR